MRVITFPKTAEGVWTNSETGVDIVIYGNNYRAFRPADTSTGSIALCREVRTLAEARYHATRYVADVARPAIALAYDEAVAEDTARTEMRTADELETAALVGEERQFNDWYARRGGYRTGMIELDHTEALADDAAYRQNAEYLRSIRPDVLADHAEALVIDRGYPSGQSRNWRARVYQRAVEMDASTPHMGHAHDSLLDEAHAEAVAEQIGRFLDCTAAHSWTEPHLFEDDEIELNREGYDEYERCGKPADDPLHIEGAHAVALTSNLLRDHLARSESFGFIRRIRELRELTGCGLREGRQGVIDADHAEALRMDGTTDIQIADVLAEHGDPYAAARAEAVETYKSLARSIWKIRAAGNPDNLSRDLLHNLRSGMRTLRGVIELYDSLAESWRMEIRAGSARDSFSRKF
jgi:hypothetical protein